MIVNSLDIQYWLSPDINQVDNEYVVIGINVKMGTVYSLCSVLVESNNICIDLLKRLKILT